MPPNLASPEEIVALASVHGAVSRRVRWSTCRRSFAWGYDDADRRLLRDMAIASGGKPVHVNLLLRFTNDPDMWRTCLDVLEGYARDGLRLYPMASANPKGLHFTLDDTIVLDEMPKFRATLSLPLAERMRALADPQVRDALRRDLVEHADRSIQWAWTDVLVAGVRDEEHARDGRALDRRARPPTWRRRARHTCSISRSPKTSRRSS